MAAGLDPIKVLFGVGGLFVGYEIIINGLAKKDCSSIGGQLTQNIAGLMKLPYVCGTSAHTAQAAGGAAPPSTNPPASSNAPHPPANPNVHSEGPPAGSWNSTETFTQHGYFGTDGKTMYDISHIYTVYRVDASVDPSGYWVTGPLG